MPKNVMKILVCLFVFCSRDYISGLCAGGNNVAVTAVL